MPPYSSEVELKDALGIQSWRNLSKTTFLQFLDRLPEVDPEVALRIIDQVPEMTELAQSVLSDAAKAYDAALTSNARSREMVHEIHQQSLEMLKVELDKELTPVERMRVLDEIREINLNAHSSDIENKTFIATQFDKRLAAGAVAAATVVAVMIAAVKSGGTPTFGAGRLFES